MPRIEHIIIGLIVVWAIIAIARHANRTKADEERPSWAVRAINAAGGNVEANRLFPATGELVGRGVGAARARWSRGRPVRAETREAQRERAAELVGKAREAAVSRGRAVVEATQRRWGGRDGDPGRRLAWWPRRGEADGTPEAADSGTGAERPQHKLVWDGEKWLRVPVDEADAPMGDTASDGPKTEEDATPVTPEAATPRPRWRLLRRFVWWRRNDETGDTEAPAAARTPETVPADTGNPITDPAVRAAWQRLAASSAGYCTPEKCTGNGTYVQITIDGVRKTSCPTCTDHKENTDMEATARPRTTDIPRQASTRDGNGWPVNDAATVAQLSPMDWGQVADRVRDFEAGADYELINFMTGEVAGICTYAAAYEQLHASCVDTIGLDPVAVQGLGEFTEHVMELAKAMGDAHQQFLVQYQEILQAVANGVVLPYNGRWMTGEAAV
ncbi:hypothetical protein ACQP2T_27990 [Nonomuraea sp. CA-143628]|uniref:hypothetical protein n=1 Tax=Nonomuraea sp. CA-143628 TaxID=3239997 RepID=UPI003D8E985A